MKKQAIGLGVALLSAAGLGLGGLAHASADSQTSTTTVDPNNVGTLTLYDAAGAPVTSGSLSAPLAAYAAGPVLRSGDDRAALYAYTPSDAASDPSHGAPGAWTGTELTADAAYPASGGPSVPSGSPVATVTASSLTLAQYIAAYPATGADSNNYELRLQSSAPGKGTASTYDALDITVDPAAGTWSVGTSNVTSTTTTLAVSPATASTGATLTLTASVTPADAAGTVQFYDGTKAVGAAVPVSNGTATTTLAATGGAHTFKASFTPTDATAYGASSGTKSYTVAARATTTSLTVSPTAPKAGAEVTLNASVTAGVPGRVQFSSGSTKIGAPVTVAAGKARTTVVLTTAGSHTFKATFTPTSTASYQQSTGSRTVTVGKATPTVTIGLPASVKHTAHATLTVTVTVAHLSVTGSVTIDDGVRKLATVPLKAGKATYRLPLLTKGKHTIKVTYGGSANVGARTASKAITSK